MSSIRERGGKYMVTWRDASGKQRGKTCRSMIEARKLARTVERGGEPEVTSNALSAHVRSGTIAAYAPDWLASKQLSDSGRRFYRLVIDTYLIPRFTAPMDKITAQMVRVWFRELEQTKSGAMVRKIRSVASSMWRDAIEDGIVLSNPWTGQRIKPHAAKQKNIMTPDTYRLLLKEIGPEYRLLIRTLAETGLRWSEAMRLVPEDISGTTLFVRASKSGKARSVAISPDLAFALKSLPFVTKTGAKIDYATFRRWHWEPVMRGTGFTLHDLRHAHASWLLQGGADLIAVRDRLGHSNINITSRYLHSLPDAGDRALAALDRVLAS